MLSVPVPRVVEPSLKVTVPVGVPEPLVGGDGRGEGHVCPNVDGFGLEVRLVVVLILTTWARSGTSRLAMGLPMPVTWS